MVGNGVVVGKSPDGRIGGLYNTSGVEFHSTQVVVQPSISQVRVQGVVEGVGTTYPGRLKFRGCYPTRLRTANRPNRFLEPNQIIHMVRDELTLDTACRAGLHDVVPPPCRLPSQSSQGARRHIHSSPWTSHSAGSQRPVCPLCTRGCFIPHTDIVTIELFTLVIYSEHFSSRCSVDYYSPIYYVP